MKPDSNHVENGNALSTKDKDQAAKEKHSEKILDQALKDTFPASDPVAIVSPKKTPKNTETKTTSS